jgi:peroxiredoxin
MYAPLVSLLLASSLAAGDVESGALLTYRGTLIAERSEGDPALTRKSFDLHLLVAERDGETGLLLWTIAEEGRGGWPWPDRFGRIEVDRLWRTGAGTAPSLLYERPEGLSLVPLALPLMATEKQLAKGYEWSQDRLTHTVEGSERVGEKNAWRVAGGNLYGTRRTLWIDSQSPRVLRLREKVFIGQGEEHELRFELQAEKQLADAELTRTKLAFQELAALRDSLGHVPRTPRLTWNEEQLAALREKLTEVVELAVDTPLADIAAVAAGDTKDQKNRAVAIEALAKRIVGKPVEAFELPTLDGGLLKSDDLRGKVTVLHFWEYRDTPLEEPYGQIGYLDFLHRRRMAEDVQVFGVAVDERHAEEATRRAAAAGTKKLRSFMNLGYGLLLDDGRVLKQFGDPRVTGAKLPVCVVIDPAGKVTHYRVGFYDVDRDRGLKELDDAITAAAKKGE